MAIIKAQKIPSKKTSSFEILASFCYHFPQYTLEQARALPYKQIVGMLRAVQKERAKIMIELTNIIAAPHTKRGSGVKKMIDYYKSIIDS